MQTLEVENARASYDAEKRIVTVEYFGALSASVTIEVYSWLEELFKEVDINSLYGQIFDFRRVEQFAQDNLKTARKTSSRMNMRIDTSNVPVALLVGDPYHQEILRGSMRISPEHVRKRIVWSEEEADLFFKKWHAERG